MNTRLKKYSFLTKFIKTFISIALLIYIIKNIDIKNCLSLLKQTHLLYLGLAFIFISCTNFLLTYRWSQVLSQLKTNIKLWKLFEIHYIALFFSQFLPSRIGGDVVKGYYINKYNKNILNASISVIIDRLSGIISFIVLNIIAVIIGFHLLTPWIVGTLIAIDILIIFILWLLYQQSQPKIIPSVIQKLLDKIIPSSKKKELRNYLIDLTSDHTFIIRITWHSFIINFMFILINYLCALALNIPLPLVFFVIFIPIISTITLLPISINGIGLREYLMIIMFQAAGLSIDQAFSLGLVHRLIVTLNCSIGGVIYIFHKNKTPLNLIKKDEQI